MSEIRVFGVPGSLRKGAYTTALLRAAVELAPEGMAIEIGDIHGFPIFNQDEEGSPPPPVREFKEKVRAADAILFSINEHNFGLSAAEKNAIDWGSRPSSDNVWNGKPAGIMSVGTGRMGGARAQYELRQSMVSLNMFPINRPEVIVTMAASKFDTEGRLTDEPTRRIVADHLVQLARHTRLLTR